MNILVYIISIRRPVLHHGFLVYKELEFSKRDWYITYNPDYATRFESKEKAFEAFKAWSQSNEYDAQYFEKV